MLVERNDAMTLGPPVFKLRAACADAAAYNIAAKGIFEQEHVLGVAPPIVHRERFWMQCGRVGCQRQVGLGPDDTVIDGRADGAPQANECLGRKVTVEATGFVARLGQLACLGPEPLG